MLLLVSQSSSSTHRFVKFLCQPDAELAIREMDKKKIDGSEIVVKRSEDKRYLNCR